MYIKTLTIQGFKSYRDQTQIEPFSPRHNVVVGRNGSGKSNFFAAIRFVLSDAYTSMSREERQALLHEGISTTTTLSAYVEIVFDNSDNRFPTGRDEVVLRRTIGLKKDEYSLDKKSASKADVMNLLESAGFSKANPYYIVPQGRITALTNAKDHERLALLKEVAGTKVYEQRRAESLRIMSETEGKKSKIIELLDFIETRLGELEEEKEELKEFQEKDKEKRCLEYALYQRELEEVAEALEDIGEERKKELHGANQRREMFSDREQQIQTLEKQISAAKHELSTLQLTKHGAQAELADLTRSQKELELRIADLRAADARAGGQRSALQDELVDVEARITQKEAALTALLPQWEAHRASEAEERRALDDASGKLAALYAKQGRLERFRTRAERDQYLRGELGALESHRAAQNDALKASSLELQTAVALRDQLDEQMADVIKRGEDSRKNVREFGEELAKLADQRGDWVEQRKDLWREDAKLDSTRNHAADELRSAERALASMMDKDTGTGLRAVDSIAERLNLDGVYGPLYRLFEVTDEKFNTAVELTAGNSLFHVVVDTDQTASKLLEVMLRERTGRVTFMPLNRLKPKNLAPLNADDAIPLLEKLRYDPRHAKAFQQVFGRTCVCRDLTVAAAYVKSHGINTITLDGDKVDRKGALTGGYHDIRRSRLEAVKNVSTWRSKVTTEETRSREVKAATLKLDQEIARVSGRTQILSNQQKVAREVREGIGAEIATIKKEKERVEGRISKLEEDVQELSGELRALSARIEVYRVELSSPMVQELSRVERDFIDELSRDIEARQKLLVEMGKTKTELGKNKNIIQIELNESLRRRRDELRSQMEGLGEPEVGDANAADDLKVQTHEISSVNNAIGALIKKVQEMERAMDKLLHDLQEHRGNLEAMQNQQAEDGRSMAKQQKSTERYLAKKNLLVNKKDECNRNIRDLGVLPEEAFDKYINEKSDRLVRKLHTVNEGLKKFAHVNKKAFEQYNNFTKQRDQLLKRREDLEKSGESIEQLVEVLDQRKDEAIERTFKQVARNFEEVFENLVPAGQGKLIIQRRIDQDDEEVEEAEDSQQRTVDNYTGVAIKVSFNSKVDEGLRIQQLSGGQKSLVALALVFAIQKCDPAPFYLFDEIDANLDAQYRTAVASMIHSLSSSGQFITTTFRPEMLVSADKFYGVLFNNQKISSIRSIKKEEAMEFVDQEAQAQ
ncbi:structural maintenance of chromosome protein 3 [Russula earlei]|uniref:Structural maintenance of chromosome protein 3 n=1 Tax=Russula earlei TaxID=71964 RepID=A0ACC0UAS0_9AGAM|nr:structural maintenance of chromosome protein 3 [Russula earlei]